MERMKLMDLAEASSDINREVILILCRTKGR